MTSIKLNKRAGNIPGGLGSIPLNVTPVKGGRGGGNGEHLLPIHVCAKALTHKKLKIRMLERIR